VQGTGSADISKDISIPHAALIVRKGYHKDMDSYSALFEADHKTPTGRAGTEYPLIELNRPCC
jgi:nicotinamidase/pyrazinamidase